METVAFVADGKAWALSPEGERLVCLFETTNPGPFAWGPLGDRALLANLEVRGLTGAPSRPPEELVPGPLSWGRPTGKSVVFVSPDQRSLEKVHLDRTALEDVSPFRGVEYLNVVYHPSGLAFGLVVQRGRNQAIWLSSNTGQDPQRVVFTEMGTEFGALAFAVNGRTLLYGAQHADNHADLHQIDLTDTSRAPVLWSGPVGQRILDIWPGTAPKTVAFTVGTSCADSTAMVRTRETPRGRPLLPIESRSTRILGWVDADRILVGAGPCGAPLDLTTVSLSTGADTPLALGIETASVRTPARTPPPPLPAELDVDGGFA